MFRRGEPQKASPRAGATGPVTELLRLPDGLVLPCDHTRSAQLPAEDWVRHGAMPIAHDTIAVSDAASTPLLALLPDHPKFVLASPSQIEAAHHRHFGEHLARRAETRVPEDLSCRRFNGFYARNKAHMPLVSLSGLGFVLATPSTAALVLTTWCILTLICVTLLKLFCVCATLIVRRTHSDPPPLAPADLPLISVMVPLHKESRIAERLVRRMRRLDYPQDKLDVLFVVEEHDAKTRKALDNAAPLPFGFRVIVVPDGHPKTKPRALNYALDFCRGSIVGVYDAEDAPKRTSCAKWPPPLLPLRPKLCACKAAWTTTIRATTGYRAVLQRNMRLGSA